MSTILKALRRLEEDRSIHEQRPLRETVTAGGSDTAKPSRRRRAWLVGLTLLLGAGAGAGALAFWSVIDHESVQLAGVAPVPSSSTADHGAISQPEPAAAAGRIRGATAAPASEAPASVVEPALETQRELPDAALSSRVERLERAPAGPRIDDAELLAATEPAFAEPRLVRGQPLLPAERLPGRHRAEPGVAVLARAEPTPQSEPTQGLAPAGDPVRRAPEPVATSPQPKPDPVAPSAPEPLAPRAESPSVPVLADWAAPAPEVLAAADEQPASVRVRHVEAPPEPAAGETLAATVPDAPIARAEVPDLWVARTSWHPTASRRSATVQFRAGDSLEVHEGDAVGTLVVARIEPSSVIFLHEGVEIRRRVGQR